MRMILQGQCHGLKADNALLTVQRSAKLWYANRHFLLLVFFTFLFTQAWPQGAVKYTVTYVAESTTLYKIVDSVDAFNIVEKVQLLPEVKKDSIIKQIYTNNDIKTTIYHLANNQFEDWQTKPFKTVIDKSRIKIYDNTGSLLLNELHSLKYKSINSQLKSLLTSESEDVIPDYVFLTAGMKADFVANGFVQTNLGGGNFKYEKDSVILYFNNSKRLNEMQLYHTDGSLKLSVKRAFALNSYSQVVPSAEVRTRTDARFPNNCVQEMEIVQYPYYNIIMATPGKWDAGDEDGIEFTINPNPASNKITLNVTPIDLDRTIFLYDNTGHKMMELILNATEYELDVDIEQLSDGIYYLQLVNGPSLITTPFIKN